MTLQSILTTISGYIVPLTGMLSFIGIVLKSVKKFLKEEIREEIKTNNEQMSKKMDENNDKIVSALKDITQKQDLSKQASLAALRHEITEIYDTYYPLGYLPTNIKKDLFSLFDAYSQCGGNSYIAELFMELKDLPTK